jgi:hypothetical protein
MRLDFVNAVMEHFRLLNDLGFSVTEQLPTIVRYQKGDIQVDVYHGRQSHELGFGIERRGVRYSLSDLMRASDPKAIEQARNFAATTETGVAEGLKRLAELVTRYGEPALKDDPEFFELLANQRQLWAERYALDVLAKQLRPEAHDAFRNGRYLEAADLYERIRPCLTPAELQKLAIAKDRCQQ